MSKVRTTRAPVRPEGETPEAVREDIRPVKQRARKGIGTDRFHIPQEMIPEGIDLQWNTDTVLGQPVMQERSMMEQQGWEAVTPDMFDGRFDGMFMRKGHQGEISVGGLVLMWRPIELTMEARAEEYHAARLARHTEERKMTSGSVDGVDPAILTNDNPHARNMTFLRKEHKPSMPVQD